MAGERTPLVDAILAAPIGVCLLASLEARARGLQAWELPEDVDPDAVSRAADRLTSSSLGELLAVAVDQAESSAGAWRSEAPACLVAAYQGAAERRPIAEAIVKRHGDALEAPIDLARQEWWTTVDPSRDEPWAGRCFVDLTTGYDGGEFPYRGLWTTGAPPGEAHMAMIGAWELYPDRVSRWHLPVVDAPRVWEVHRPEDWVRLVETFGRDADPHSSWSVPGPNQHPSELAPLIAVPGQRAARTSVTRHRVPDWSAVAEEHDAVHLSWAGFLTAEGFVSDLPSGGVAMLRYWFAERTCWLRDCFGEPEPMAGPVVVERLGETVWSVDVTSEATRRDHDRRWLGMMLGR